jgi:RNA polymerase sigma-70 factor (ECF subfamily)
MPDENALDPAAPGLRPEEDGAQVEKARQDPQAFGVLYDRHVQSIYRYLVSRLHNVEEAKDLTSQTFLAAFEAFPRYRHNGHFPAWLFAIARSKMVDHLRKESRRSQAWFDALKLHGSPANEAGDPLQEIVQGERTAALCGLIAELPQDEQELLRLRYVAELSFADIAALTKRSEEAVKKSVYRLLARLQSALPNGSLLESEHD